MRTDIENLTDGARICIHPRSNNPIQKEPKTAVYASGYFYLDGEPPEDGPSYYSGDFMRYCRGFEIMEEKR